jgi:O-succinylbenzoic acid--CoA ligase
MMDWLGQQARVSGRKVALVEGERQWSYAELNGLVDRLAGRLGAAGVGAGMHVAVLMPNRVEYVCLIHGLARLGAVLVPLNIRLTGTELKWQVEQAGCAVVVCSQETERQAVALAAPERTVLSVDSPQAREAKALSDFADGGAAHRQQGPFSLDQLQGIVYTSGTTGQPKGAMLSYGNHFWSATASAFRLGTAPDDRWLVCMPLYHVGGMAIILRCCLYGTAVVLQHGFDPEAVGQALKDQGVTLISVVPTMLHRLLETAPDALVSAKLRCILIGGAAANPDLVEQCLALGLPVAASYGLTEAASQVATAFSAQIGNKPGCVGKPLMFSSVRIAAEDGQSLPAGAIGEIVVQGPTVMQEYYQQPEATARALRQGELYTGDMGYLDEAGDLWVVQRRADLIVSGGENVYPAEVEQALQRHPAVKDVCVVGLEDAEWGQVVVAAVVLAGGATLTAAELIAFGRERLAGYKQPRQIRFVEALPRTASGKIRRDEVRALFSDRLK